MSAQSYKRSCYNCATGQCISFYCIACSHTTQCSYSKKCYNSNRTVAIYKDSTFLALHCLNNYQASTAADMALARKPQSTSATQQPILNRGAWSQCHRTVPYRYPAGSASPLHLALLTKKYAAHRQSAAYGPPIRGSGPTERAQSYIRQEQGMHDCDRHTHSQLSIMMLLRASTALADKQPTIIAKLIACIDNELCWHVSRLAAGAATDKAVECACTSW